MKPIIILLSIFMSGCATYVEVPKVNVKPTPAIMEDCEKFSLLNEDRFATPKDLLNNISLNKKIYDSCNELNKSKKNFIEKLDF